MSPQLCLFIDMLGVPQFPSTSTGFNLNFLSENATLGFCCLYFASVIVDLTMFQIKTTSKF